MQTTSPASDKDKALQAALALMNKQFGQGTVMNMNDRVRVWPSIPTGSMRIDSALGIGGLPRGRIVEVYGPEASGKTTLTLSVAAEAQKAGGHVMFIDVEHALDPEYAEKLGVDLSKLHVSQPTTAEEALDIAEIAVRSGAFDLVVIDSVAALVPKAELEGDMGDALPGLQARLMSQAMRKLTGAVKSSKTCLVFINQIRMKIGVMFGSPETTAGGNALKFYASVRLDIRRISSKKLGDEVIGNEVKIKVAKNKMAPPFKVTKTEIIFGQGFNQLGEIIDFGVELDFIQKSGSWFSYGDQRIGQGRDKTQNFLAENDAVREELIERIRKAVFKPKEEPAAENVETSQEAAASKAA